MLLETKNKYAAPEKTCFIYFEAQKQGVRISLPNPQNYYGNNFLVSDIMNEEANLRTRAELFGLMAVYSWVFIR